MPYTLNGIGTRYVGAKNRSAAVGDCEACKKSATLTSYDTREWFCFAFIPLIPLTKYRILDYCSRCRRHRRMKASEFQQAVDQKLAPQREAIRRSPRDPQPYIDLIRTLAAWHMQSEAQREVEAALALFSDNVDLLLIGGQLAIGRNDFPAALELYERARRADPQNGSVAYSLAWLLHETGKYNEAIPLLQQAPAQEANRGGALYLLGSSSMKLSRWQDALQAFQQLLTVQPAYVNDKALLRQIRECKLKLGYELNDAERRAGRRWWPFGGKKKRAEFQKSGPVQVRPGLKVAGIIILAVSVFSIGFYEWDRWQNLQLYVDNALDHRVGVDLDGNRFNVGRDSFEQEELSPGHHAIVVREANGKEIERRQFDLQRMSLLDSMFHDRFFVYNIGSQRVYRRAKVGYAANAEDRSYSDQLIGMQPFFEQRDVDYAFTNPPETISVDSKSSSETKIVFNAARDVTLARYAIIRAGQGKQKEAMEAIRLAVVNAPCDTAVRRMQIYVVGKAASPDAASAAAKQWIADCRGHDLEAHRAYQDLNIALGRHDALRDEYGKLVAGAPNSGEMHYLYGRTLPDSAAASAEFQKALELDPSIAWARAALARSYLVLERYDDAFREYGQTLDMKDVDPSVVLLFAMAAISKGDSAGAADRVDQWVKAHPKDASGLHARWLIAAASGDWKTTTAVQKALAPMEDEVSSWWRKANALRLQDDLSLDAAIDAAMKNRALKGAAITMRAERRIEKGEFAPAAELLAQHANDLGPSATAVLEAYAAGGLMLRGEQEPAMKVLDVAENTLGDFRKNPEGRIAAMLISSLRGTMQVDAAMTFAKENNAFAPAWFAAAVRAAGSHDKAGAANALDRCRRAASDLEFPYSAAVSMRGML